MKSEGTGCQTGGLCIQRGGSTFQAFSLFIFSPFSIVGGGGVGDSKLGWVTATQEAGAGAVLSVQEVETVLVTLETQFQKKGSWVCWLVQG